MTHTIPANTAKNALLELASALTAKGANCAAFKRPGMVKETFLPLPRLAEELALQPGAVSVTFGLLTPGLPFEPLEDGIKYATPAAPAVKAPTPGPTPTQKQTPPTQKDTPTSQKDITPGRQKQTPSAKKTLPPPRRPAVDSVEALRVLRQKSGTYIGYIDSLILDVESEADADDEYPRSRHTIFDAVALVSKKFPGKDVASVKRICKVRPRHLERMKTLGIFDEDAGVRAPRWARVGPGVKAPVAAAKKKTATKKTPPPAKKTLPPATKKACASDARKKAWVTRRANAAKKTGASK